MYLRKRAKIRKEERERCIDGIFLFCCSNACGGCETTETLSTEGWDNVVF